MKKIASALVLFASLTLFGQDGIKFQDIPLKELLAKAKKEKKLLFIDAFTTWCGPCKMMEKNTFPKKSVGDYFNSNFVNSRFDMEKGEGREIAAKYGVRSYPSYLFLNGEGELIAQNNGYMEESLFLAMAQDVNAPNNKKGSTKERFAKGEKDPEFLINIMKLNMNSDYEFAKKASERYFSNKKATEELTKDEVGYLIYFIKTTDDLNYKTYVSRKDEILKFLPQETYKEFNDQVILSKIVTESIDDANRKVKDDYFMQKAEPLVGFATAKKKLDQTKLSYYEQNANFSEYEKIALEYYSNADAFEPTELLKAAWIFSDNVTNKASLKKAAEWAEKSVMRGDTAENTYILAKIYYLLGNLELAKNFAEISENMAKKSGANSALAEELLSKITK